MSFSDDLRQLCEEAFADRVALVQVGCGFGFFDSGEVASRSAALAGPLGSVFDESEQVAADLGVVGLVDLHENR